MKRSILLVALRLVVSATSFSLCLSAVGQTAERGQAFCYQIEKLVNGLVDYTQTSCFPAASSGKSYSFVLVSSQPVFSVEESKKGWLLVAVAAVGDTFNKNPSVKAGELWLSDAARMKDRNAYVMNASVAASLQRRVKADQIDLEGMYSEIVRNLKLKTIPKR